MSDNPVTYVQIGNVTVPTDGAPQDRTFRDAWALDADNAIVVDMDKAREIHRTELRRAREPQFKVLDDKARILGRRKDINGTLNAGDKAEYAAVEAEAQRLRDVTADPRIDEVLTPDELKALTLDVLLSD